MVQINTPFRYADREEYWADIPYQSDEFDDVPLPDAVVGIMAERDGSVAYLSRHDTGSSRRKSGHYSSRAVANGKKRQTARQNPRTICRNLQLPTRTTCLVSRTPRKGRFLLIHRLNCHHQACSPALYTVLPLTRLAVSSWRRWFLPPALKPICTHAPSPRVGYSRINWS